MAHSATYPCSDVWSIVCDLNGRVDADLTAKTGYVDSPEHSGVAEIESNDNLILGRDMDRVVVREGAYQPKREAHAFRPRHRSLVMDDGPFVEDLQNTCFQSAAQAEKAPVAIPGTTTENGDLASNPFSPFNLKRAGSRAEQ